ncbi:hypothetical protein B1R32_12127 [Abditibacterium utsteinense]|uniref:Uncharacterized protein n=1 Tax=Abditibacterium utsteinense TaxID=1960156 RepID=A0A2S8SPT9_9BACT|nr:hypothetical protein [Abditibacterium utsteinense]PQV62815.1 hypothetical protein B1R32_12127 [Abditibacterium utsteinense]
MQNTFRALCARASRASLAAILVALAGLSAPVTVAHADVSPSSSDTVLVPRITKGAYGTSMRVKANSPEARRFFAAQSRSASRSNTNCPGTICPQTRTCYPVKGALGARCVTK